MRIAYNISRKEEDSQGRIDRIGEGRPDAENTKEAERQAENPQIGIITGKISLSAGSIENQTHHNHCGADHGHVHNGWVIKGSCGGQKKRFNKGLYVNLPQISYKDCENNHILRVFHKYYNDIKPRNLLCGMHMLITIMPIMTMRENIEIVNALR